MTDIIDLYPEGFDAPAEIDESKLVEYELVAYVDGAEVYRKTSPLAAIIEQSLNDAEQAVMRATIIEDTYDLLGEND